MLALILTHAVKAHNACLHHYNSGVACSPRRSRSHTDTRWSDLSSGYFSDIMKSLLLLRYMGQPPWIRRGHHVAVRYTAVARCTVWSCASPRVCVRTGAASRRFAANVKVYAWQLTGRGQEARPRRSGVTKRKSVRRPLQLNFRWKKRFYLLFWCAFYF